MRLLSKLLRRFIRQGTLRVTDVKGRVHVFGDRLPGPNVGINLHDRKLYTKLFINPELYAAEAYMDGALTLDGGAAIHNFLLLFSINRAGLYSYGSQKLMRRIWRGLRRWHQANPIGLAAAHARHHYDISTELYRLFLDDQMQYSCAYFRDPERDTLEQAQRNKLVHATSKLRLKPGMTVAEIGSGWGGFAIHLARETGAHVTAINVSPEQIKVARDHAEAAGVSDRIEFRELDYRLLTGQFDRVVSVGMMEHVGIGHLDEYFRRDSRTTDARWFCFHSLHWPDVAARHHWPVHPQIHLSRRLCARAVGDFRRNRALRSVVQRYGSTSAALSPHDKALA